MREKLGFEGLVPSSGFGSAPDGYGGMVWDQVEILGKRYIDANFQDDGYHNVIDKRAVAFTQSDDTLIFAQTNTFSLRNGVFAAAWNAGETVTFLAYSGGEVVASKTVVLDQTATKISFGHHFQHIDGFEILTSGGTDANPSDGGSGGFIAMDDIRIVSDDAFVAHAWYPHASDWPLA